MSQNDDDIFDDSFDDLDEGGASYSGGGSGGGGGNSLLDLWNNNPMVKLAIIGGLLVIGIGSVYAYMASQDKDKPNSMVNMAPDKKEAPGGDVSENYGDALEEQNQQKLEAALGNRGMSAIPIPVNRDDASLGTQGEGSISAEDPLAIWQRENTQATPVSDVPLPEEPLPVPVAPPPVQASPQQVEDLSRAIANQIQSILSNRGVKTAQLRVYDTDQIIEANLVRPSATGEYGFPADKEAAKAEAAAKSKETNAKEILVPAGTILYGQIMNQADSYAPGPIVAQMLSGPLVGSRVIGKFQKKGKLLIITFNTVVVKGVGNNMNGVAIDPSTTSPGLATDVDNHYFERIILPGAARFLEGLGSAYSQQETQVFTSGDVIVTNQNKLNTKQELARGVEEAAREAGDTLKDEADDLKPRIRVEAGTPIGIVLVDPIIKPTQNAVYKPE